MNRDYRFFDILTEDKEFEKHPKDEELSDFLEDKLNSEDRDKLEEHLVECKRCRDVLVNVIEYQKKSTKKLKPTNNIKYFFSFLMIAAVAVGVVSIDSVFEREIEKNIKYADTKGINDTVVSEVKNRDKIIENIRKNSKFSHPSLELIKKYRKNSDTKEAIKASYQAIEDIFYKISFDRKIRIEQYILILDDLIVLEKLSNNTEKIKELNNKLNEEIDIYIDEYGGKK